MRLGAAGRRVPSLEEVVGWANRHPGLLLDVEIKEVPAATAAVQRLDGCRAPFVVTSFLPRALLRVKRLRPAFRTGLLAHRRRPQRVGQVRRVGAEILVLGQGDAGARRIRRALDSGALVWVWDADDPAVALRQAALGAQAFITDTPRALMRNLISLEQG